jgi:CPA2 family monovalent cation:H+ antiporter-2
VLVKIAGGFLAARVLPLPPRTALMVGLSLAQIGEFSFILAQSGLSYELIDQNSYQVFLAVSILTMAAAPFMIANAARLSEVLPLKRVAQ